MQRATNFSILLIALGCLVLAWYIGSIYNMMMWTIIDSLSARYVESLRTPLLSQLMIGITIFGGWGTVLGWFTLGVFLLVKRRYLLMVMSIILAVTSIGLGIYLKEYFQRARPTDYLFIQELSYSFPSLHVLASIVFYLTLTYVVYRITGKFWVTLMIHIGLVVLGMLVALSRMYLGVHYFSDVLAGMFWGYGLFALALFGVRMWDTFSSRK